MCAYPRAEKSECTPAFHDTRLFYSQLISGLERVEHEIVHIRLGAQHFEKEKTGTRASII